MQPFAYERIDESTWMYVSSFLILSFFFKFNRLWSIRNLDLFLIIMLAPGLLMIQSGVQTHKKFSQPQTLEQGDDDPYRNSSGSIRQASFAPQATEAEPHDTAAPELSTTAQPAASRWVNAPGLGFQRLGYLWMFVVGGLILIRMLVDPLFERRPVLEPNLSIGGMVFLGFSLLFFVLANVATYSPAQEDIQGAKNAVKILKLEAAGEGEDKHLIQRGPGYRLLYVLPVMSVFGDGDQVGEETYIVAAKSVAITSQILIVAGLILFCHFHFSNFHTGVGIATIYMLSPYTAIFTGNVLHTVPAALLIWAMVCYRLPLLAGIFIGLATGVSYYPLFLLALWISFYWERGWRRFLIGFSASIVVCVCGLICTSTDMMDFVGQLQAMFAFWRPFMQGLEGIWALGPNPIWRVPILIGFVLFCASFVAWPTEKDIGTLLSYTAAVMVAVQFWHGFGGGLFVAWYLPLILLVFFRPNVVGRVASRDVGPFRRPVADAS